MNVIEISKELPCEITGKPCQWIYDDYDDGEILLWDLYCQDCFRSRDWEKNECDEPPNE